jgi:hypothetical protein
LDGVDEGVGEKGGRNGVFVRINEVGVLGHDELEEESYPQAKDAKKENGAAWAKRIEWGVWVCGWAG